LNKKKRLYYSFRRRWRDVLGFRLSNKLAKQRAISVDERSIQQFYDLVQKTINELGLTDKPQNIYNVDETNFSGAPSNVRVFCRRGSANVNNLTSNNEKINYTVQV
jgi:hypothetical protein